MMKRYVCIVLCFCSLHLMSQVESAGTPISYSLENYQYNKGVIFEYLSNDSLANLAKEEDNKYRYKIGIVRDTDIDFKEVCKVDYIENYIIATYRIKCSGAKGIKLLFSNLRLSEGSKLFLFNKNKSILYGAFTSQIETEEGSNSIRSFEDEELIIELNCTIEEFEQTSINISGISHNFYNSDDYGDALQDCHNNVNCTPYDNWCNEKRSVVKMEISICCANKDDWAVTAFGVFVSTAVLVNDGTNNSRGQKLLTAYHALGCYENNTCNDLSKKFSTASLNSVIFYFNFESPYCYNKDPDLEDAYTLSGGVELLNTECRMTDILYIKTKKEVPLQYNYYYSGVDFRVNRNENTDLTVIHHPRGDVKKITFGDYSNPYHNTRKWYYYFYLPFFYKFKYTSGIVEPGSSGAPVYDVNRRVIGVVSHGVINPTCEADYFNFGRIDYCFNSTVTNGLDPLRECIDNVHLYGIFGDASRFRHQKHNIILQGKNIHLGSSSDPSEFKTNSSYSIQAENEINITDNVGDYSMDLLGGNTITNSDVEIEFYTAPCIYTQDNCGFNYFKISENRDDISENHFNQKELNHEISVYPNPTNNNSTLSLFGYKNQKVDVEILDQSGIVITSKQIPIVENNNQKIEIESKDWASGIYIIRVRTSAGNKAIKLVKK